MNSNYRVGTYFKTEYHQAPTLADVIPGYVCPAERPKEEPIRYKRTQTSQRSFFSTRGAGAAPAYSGVGAPSMTSGRFGGGISNYGGTSAYGGNKYNMGSSKYGGATGNYGGYGGGATGNYGGNAYGSNYGSSAYGAGAGTSVYGGGAGKYDAALTAGTKKPDNYSHRSEKTDIPMSDKYQSKYNTNAGSGVSNPTSFSSQIPTTGKTDLYSQQNYGGASSKYGADAVGSKYSGADTKYISKSSNKYTGEGTSKYAGVEADKYTSKPPKSTDYSTATKSTYGTTGQASNYTASKPDATEFMAKHGSSKYQKESSYDPTSISTKAQLTQPQQQKAVEMPKGSTTFKLGQTTTYAQGPVSNAPTIQRGDTDFPKYNGGNYSTPTRTSSAPRAQASPPQSDQGQQQRPARVSFKNADPNGDVLRMKILQAQQRAAAQAEQEAQERFQREVQRKSEKEKDAEQSSVEGEAPKAEDIEVVGEEESVGKKIPVHTVGDSDGEEEEEEEDAGDNFDPKKVLPQPTFPGSDAQQIQNNTSIGPDFDFSESDNDTNLESPTLLTPEPSPAKKTPQREPLISQGQGKSIMEMFSLRGQTRTERAMASGRLPIGGYEDEGTKVPVAQPDVSLDAAEDIDSPSKRVPIAKPEESIDVRGNESAEGLSKSYKKKASSSSSDSPLQSPASLKVPVMVPSEYEEEEEEEEAKEKVQRIKVPAEIIVTKPVVTAAPPLSKPLPQHREVEEEESEEYGPNSTAINASGIALEGDSISADSKTSGSAKASAIGIDEESSGAHISVLNEKSSSSIDDDVIDEIVNRSRFRICVSAKEHEEEEEEEEEEEVLSKTELNESSLNGTIDQNTTNEANVSTGSNKSMPKPNSSEDEPTLDISADLLEKAKLGESENEEDPSLNISTGSNKSSKSAKSNGCEDDVTLNVSTASANASKNNNSEDEVTLNVSTASANASKEGVLSKINNSEEDEDGADPSLNISTGSNQRSVDDEDVSVSIHIEEGKPNDKEEEDTDDPSLHVSTTSVDGAAKESPEPSLQISTGDDESEDEDDTDIKDILARYGRKIAEGSDSNSGSDDFDLKSDSYSNSGLEEEDEDDDEADFTEAQKVMTERILSNLDTSVVRYLIAVADAILEEQKELVF